MPDLLGEAMSSDEQVLDEEKISKVLAGVQIPPQPGILLEIAEEQNKTSPDLKRICAQIAKDVGLSAAVLKTVNSPFYGLPRKIDSVQRAAFLLGLGNVSNLVRSAVLRSTLSAKGVALDRFWDTAAEVADASTWLAGRLSLDNSDEFHTLGLFHDCGIAILAQKYSDYKDTLKEMNASADFPITRIEDDRYSTNHAVVGFYMAKSWNLSTELCDVILRHHDVAGLFLDGAEFVKQNHFMAVLKLAGHFAHHYRRLSDDEEWLEVKSSVLANLDLTEQEFSDLRDDFAEVMAASAS